MITIPLEKKLSKKLHRRIALEKDNQAKKRLRHFLGNYTPPKDEKDLKTLIITGAVPKTEDMLRAIKKWAR